MMVNATTLARIKRQERLKPKRVIDKHRTSEYEVRPAATMEESTGICVMDDDAGKIAEMSGSTPKCQQA